MRMIGRTSQMIGLVLPPLAIGLQLADSDFSVGQMLTMLALGVSAFYLGRIIEGYASQ